MKPFTKLNVVFGVLALSFGLSSFVCYRFLPRTTPGEEWGQGWKEYGKVSSDDPRQRNPEASQKGTSVVPEGKRGLRFTPLPLHFQSKKHPSWRAAAERKNRVMDITSASLGILSAACVAVLFVLWSIWGMAKVSPLFFREAAKVIYLFFREGAKVFRLFFREAARGIRDGSIDNPTEKHPPESSGPPTSSSPPSTS